uniref:acyl-coenzyme A thioesterase 9, mitochondrial n=1 Tax=Myxine glutinosa TaxID=7769 RepID=UPI00358E5A8B
MAVMMAANQRAIVGALRLGIQVACNAARSFTEVSSKGHLMTMNNVRSHLREIVGASEMWSHGSSRTQPHGSLPKSQTELPARRMRDSLLEVELPLGRLPELREKYINMHGGVRFGRILEELDTFAILISYQHTKKEGSMRSPLSIVTAMVDKIVVDKQQSLLVTDQDISFRGHVSWVGKTSMEVQMQVMQNGKDKLQATFVVVARDPQNQRSAFLNPLQYDGAEEEKLFTQGQLAKERRVAASKVSLLKMAPTAEEREIVHKIFLNTLDTQSVTFKARVLPENSQWMENTKLKNLMICHPQERNIHNKIFGGFLMRKAFELAWANACVYSGGRVEVFAVDDILFQNPVEIGSLLYLSSEVCYTQDKFLQVRVHSGVMNPQTRIYTTTNIFHFIFGAQLAVPQVVPHTYGESMLYLDGKRHFESSMT